MDTTQAIEIIGKSEHIGVLVGKNASFDCLAAAEVLSRALANMGKKVGFLGSDQIQIKEKRFQTLVSSLGLPREFIVSLNTDQSPISQLRYEKSEGKVDIILSPKSSSISKDAITYRDGKMLCECLVVLGVKNLEEVNVSSETDPDLFTNTPAINIDIDHANKNYGEANIVDTKKSSLSELVYQFLVSSREDPPDKESATLLLAGIVSATERFRSRLTSADTLLTASEIMRLGASLEEAQDIASGSESLGLSQLLGRASVRSRMDQDGKTLWSFATKEDFEKTGRTPQDVGNILSHLDNNFPPHRVSASLWQNPEDKKIYATLSGQRPVLETIQSQEGGEFQSPYLKLPIAFNSFREAEEKLASLLKTAL